MASTISLKQMSSLKHSNQVLCFSSKSQSLLPLNSAHQFSTLNSRNISRMPLKHKLPQSLKPRLLHNFLKKKKIKDLLSIFKKKQLFVYEINEQKPSQKPVNSLGDNNKLYSGDLEKRLGNRAEKGDRYGVIYIFDFWDYGQLWVQGANLTGKETRLDVTGGSGIFEGARGKVKVQIVSPDKRLLFYSFDLKGIKDLPNELIFKPVNPSTAVEPSAAAKATKPPALNS